MAANEDQGGVPIRLLSLLPPRNAMTDGLVISPQSKGNPAFLNPLLSLMPTQLCATALKLLVSSVYLVRMAAKVSFGEFPQATVIPVTITTPYSTPCLPRRLLLSSMDLRHLSVSIMPVDRIFPSQLAVSMDQLLKMVKEKILDLRPYTKKRVKTSAKRGGRSR